MSKKTITEYWEKISGLVSDVESKYPSNKFKQDHSYVQGMTVLKALYPICVKLEEMSSGELVRVAEKIKCVIRKSFDGGSIDINISGDASLHLAKEYHKMLIEFCNGEYTSSSFFIRVSLSKEIRKAKKQEEIIGNKIRTYERSKAIGIKSANASEDLFKRKIGKIRNKIHHLGEIDRDLVFCSGRHGLNPLYFFDRFYGETAGIERVYKKLYPVLTVEQKEEWIKSKESNSYYSLSGWGLWARSFYDKDGSPADLPKKLVKEFSLDVRRRLEGEVRLYEKILKEMEKDRAKEVVDFFGGVCHELKDVMVHLNFCAALYDERVINAFLTAYFQKINKLMRNISLHVNSPESSVHDKCSVELIGRVNALCENFSEDSKNLREGMNVFERIEKTLRYILFFAYYKFLKSISNSEDGISSFLGVKEEHDFFPALFFGLGGSLSAMMNEKLDQGGKREGFPIQRDHRESCVLKNTV